MTPRRGPQSIRSRSVAATAPLLELHFYNSMLQSIDSLVDALTTRKMTQSSFGLIIIPATTELRIALDAGYEKFRLQWLLADLEIYLDNVKVAKKAALGSPLVSFFDDTQMVVKQYRDYCNEIHYGTSPQDCELSEHFQKAGIKKDDANQICASLGAVLFRHLALVTIPDIQGIFLLPISNVSKMKFQELAQKDTQDTEKRARASMPQKASLAQMHVFLEEL